MVRTVAFLVALLVCSPTWAADDKARQKEKSGGMLALQFEFNKPAVKAAPLCACHKDANCICDRLGGPCGCCKTDMPAYGPQYANAVKTGKPLVAYFGCKGSCYDGALCSESVDLAPGKGKPCIMVSKPDHGGLTIVTVLPPDATPADIRRAIDKAK